MKLYKNKIVNQTESRGISGVQFIIEFQNGYGASIINNFMSYGGEDGLLELAVIIFDSEGDWKICYDTEITDDVIGYLTFEQTEEILDKISELKGER